MLICSFSDQSDIPSHLELVVQTTRSKNVIDIIYYPLLTCLAKSACIFVNEWTITGILKLDGERKDDFAVQNIQEFFDNLMSSKYRNLFQQSYPFLS